MVWGDLENVNQLFLVAPVHKYLKLLSIEFDGTWGDVYDSSVQQESTYSILNAVVMKLRYSLLHFIQVNSLNRPILSELQHAN